MRILPTGSLFGPDPNRQSIRILAGRQAFPFLRRGPSRAGELARRLLDVRDQLSNLRSSVGTPQASSGLLAPRTASASSDSPLRIYKAGTSTTLETSALLAPPTNLDGLVKVFSGTSTSFATLNGTYDGSLGKNVELTFTVTQGGVLGTDDTTVEVRDDDDALVTILNIDASTPDEVFDLTVGVDVSFAAGELAQDSTFTLDLSTSNGVVDPDQVFQGTGLPGGAATYEASFEQGSTPVATLAGEYAGDSDDTLRFEVRRAGIVGLQTVIIDVFDGNNQRTDRVRFRPNDPIGEAKQLSSGLTLSLSPGLVQKPDRFTVDVTADDRLVFENGQEIQAGSFDINGATIQIAKLDTLRTLADKITSSSAGVTASFDTAAGSFTLTRNDQGGRGIQLGADTTGFFDAVDLDAGTLTPGNAAGNYGVQRLDELTGLSSGTFAINGVDISIDVANDTVDDVVARINGSVSGVIASYDNDRLQLRAKDRLGTLDLDNGTSGFFQAVQVDSGLHEPEERRGRAGIRAIEDPGGLKRALGGLGRSLSLALATRGSDGRLPNLSGTLGSAIRGAFAAPGAGSTLNSGLGLRFELDDPDLLSVNDSVLQHAATQRSEELRDFLGDDDGKGLVTRLSEAVEQVLLQLSFRLDSTRDRGLLLDIKG